MKIFDKGCWIRSANMQKEEGLLNQREIDDALEIWVNDLDGKAYEELSSEGDLGPTVARDDWFIEA